MVVNDETKMQSNGTILVFDDSKSHWAYNRSDQHRVVLILDLLRPSHIPLGEAIGVHTNELDEFIASFVMK